MNDHPLSPPSPPAPSDTIVFTSPAGVTLQIATATDSGTEREENEDSCGHAVIDECALVVVADGVSGHEGGGTASKTAVGATLRVFSEQPTTVATHKRLYRAAQEANIAVYDMASVVPELRGMSTTLTAVAVAGGTLFAAHVGDTRMYLVRDGTALQLTKDHTVVAERVRMRLMSQERARKHPDRSTLTRSVGRELIVAVDRIDHPLLKDDIVIVCSDGLYNVLDAAEMREIVEGKVAGDAVRDLIASANGMGTLDNLTAAVVRVVDVPRQPAERLSWPAAVLRRLLP